jgi:sulfonate transport system permease protein
MIDAHKWSWSDRLVPWLLPAVLVIGWQCASLAGWLSGNLVPSPLSVLLAGMHLAATGELGIHLWESFRRALVGLIIGGSIGFFLGLVNGVFAMSNRVLDSSLQMIRNIPHLALIPLVIRWFGIGEEGKLFLIILGVFFPIYLNTMHGIRSTDPRLLEMGRVYGLSPWGLLTRIILPGSLPSILVGLRYALGIMWLTLIVAETIASDSGIGFMVMNARDFLQFDVVMFGILLYALLGKTADTATRGLERWFLRWNPNYRQA